MMTSLRSEWAAGKARGGRISRLIRNRRATRPPAHFHRNPIGRGRLAVSQSPNEPSNAACHLPKNRGSDRQIARAASERGNERIESDQADLSFAEACANCPAWRSRGRCFSPLFCSAWQRSWHGRPSTRRKLDYLRIEREGRLPRSGCPALKRNKSYLERFGWCDCRTEPRSLSFYSGWGQ